MSPARQGVVALVVFAALVAMPVSLYTLFSDDTPARAPQMVETAAEPAPTPRNTAAKEDVAGARLLHGHVRDSDGESLESASLVARGHKGIVGVSGADGAFRISGVPLSALVLIVSAPGFEPAQVDVAEGRAGDRSEVNITLEPARAATGVVVDPDGRAISGAAVTCREPVDDVVIGDSSDEDGSFAMPARAIGCEAVARHRDFAPSDPTTIVAGDNNELALNEAASIRGVVVDQRGAPVTSYVIEVTRHRPARGAPRTRRVRGQMLQIDDTEGRFEISGLQAGQYVLGVAAEGWPPNASDNIDVDAGELVRGIRIVMDDGAVLSGRIVDGDGDPVAGAEVKLDAIALNRVRVSAVVSDEDGHYDLDGVPKGPFSIRVSASGYIGKVIAGIETLGAETIQRDVELSATDTPGQVEYQGIGATLVASNEGVAIRSVVSGGPAEAAGLKMKDLIVRIDGRDSTDFTVSQAVQLLRGPVGSRVSMTLRRGDEDVQFVVARDKFVH
jgi:protocatechuate 3,4-dioxygenase beta subunit